MFSLACPKEDAENRSEFQTYSVPENISLSTVYQHIKVDVTVAIYYKEKHKNIFLLKNMQIDASV